MAFQLVQILYWLALATWFGGALFVMVAYRVIFKTVQENNPILPHVLSVNLEGQHGTLLAGTIMGNLLAAFMRLELGCCAVVVVCLAVQAFFLDMGNPSVFIAVMLRGGLALAAGIVVVYDWRFVWPKTWRFRQEFLDHADEPDLANPAKDQFDRYQKESVVLLEVLLFLLLGTVLFSGGMDLRPASAPVTAPVHMNAQSQINAESYRAVGGSCAARA